MAAIINNDKLTFSPDTEWNEIRETLTDRSKRELYGEIKTIDLSPCSKIERMEWGSHEDNLTFRISFENLKKFITPKSLRKIGAEFFGNCKSLNEVVLNEGLVEISDSAFEYCGALEKLDIPSTVTSIGENCFKSCSGLKLLDLSQCEKITSLKTTLCAKTIYLPINLETFEGECDHTKNIYIPPKLNQFRGKVAFKAWLWCYTDKLSTLKGIEGLRLYLCIPKTFAKKYNMIAEVEQSKIDVFVFDEDGDVFQDYFWS